MKKLICMTLVLAFCFCLACPAFASETTGGYLPSPEATEPECEHTGGSTLINAKDPTCTSDGYTGDLVCDDCGKVIKPGEVIPRIGHEYEDGVCKHCGASENNPQTGDNTPVSMWMLVMAASACTLAAVTVVYRKKFANQ